MDKHHGASPRPQPCKFPRCPALADPHRDHCPVHYPERVLDRAKQIVINEFKKNGMYRQSLRDLFETIMSDLEQTV